MASSVAVLLVICSSAALFSFAHANAFLAGHHEVMSQAHLKKTFLAEVERALGSPDKRFLQLEAALRPMYDALPKNEDGNLGHEAAKYAIHRIFVQRHGWYMKGLEPSRSSANESSPAGILKDRVPAYVEELFEERFATKGLGLHELAVLASTLERLVHNEAEWRLSSAYQALDLPEDGVLGDEDVSLAIETYIMTLLSGLNISGLTKSQVVRANKQMALGYDGWEDTLEFAADLRHSMELSSINHASAASSSLNYSSVERVVEEFGERFGQFQNRECSSMKAKLLAVEDGPGTGRVLLSEFYKLGLSENSAFSESIDTLRQIGALEKSDSKEPRLVVANYVNSPSNCLGSASFYSICCINECEDLLGHLEKEIALPSSTPEHIVQLVENLASATVSAPRALSQELRDRLVEVASHHDGVVPLHGRLFSQWMHHAFPRECPYPQVSGSASSANTVVWMDQEVFSREQMEHYIEESCRASDFHGQSTSNTTVSKAELSLGEDSEPLPWVPIEELVVPHRRKHLPGSAVLEYIRPFMLLVALVSMVLGLIQTGTTTIDAYSGAELNKYQV